MSSSSGESVFLAVSVTHRAHQAFVRRSGTVESRIRQLVMKLEYVDTLLLAHPFVKSFDRVNYCINEEEQRAVSIGEVPAAVDKRTEKDLIAGQGGTVYTTTFYIGLQIERKPGPWRSPRPPTRAHSLTLRRLSGRQGTAKTGHLVPDERIHQARQDVGQLRPRLDGRHRALHQEVRVSPSLVYSRLLTRKWTNSTALPAYVHAGREPEPPKTGGVKRAKTKVRTADFRLVSPSVSSRMTTLLRRWTAIDSSRPAHPFAPSTRTDLLAEGERY